MFQERGKQGDVGGKDRLTKEAHRMGMRRTVLLLASVVFAMLLVCGMVLVAPEKPAKAAFPGTNGKIAFETNRDGNWEIYSMNADGTEQKNLTNRTTWDMSPAWSPDGKQIAFRSDLGSSNFDVWVMNTDGTGKTRLTYGAYAMEMSWGCAHKVL